MDAPELIGYLASLLVLVTFCMSGMVALRTVAIASNVAFIGYAALAGISPVLVLHALLLPMNVYRLLQAVLERRRDRASDTMGSGGTGHAAVAARGARAHVLADMRSRSSRRVAFSRRNMCRDGSARNCPRRLQ
jgi:hypothetical protein